MRKLIVEGGIVTNVIEVSDTPDLQPDWVRALPDAGDAGPGWVRKGKGFAPPPAPVPDRAGMTLDFTQALIGFVAEGWITEAEGEAWLSGAPPAVANAWLETLAPDQRFAARVRLARPAALARLDPAVIALARSKGLTDGDLDAFFTARAV